MTLPTIEKNIPLRTGGSKGWQKKTFLKSMEVNDSFEIEAKERTSWQPFIYAHPELEFAMRKQDNGKYRIWRVK